MDNNGSHSSSPLHSPSPTSEQPQSPLAPQSSSNETLSNGNEVHDPVTHKDQESIFTFVAQSFFNLLNRFSIQAYDFELCFLSQSILIIIDFHIRCSIVFQSTESIFNSESIFTFVAQSFFNLLNRFSIQAYDFELCFLSQSILIIIDFHIRCSIVFQSTESIFNSESIFTFVAQSFFNLLNRFSIQVCSNSPSPRVLLTLGFISNFHSFSHFQVSNRNEQFVPHAFRRIVLSWYGATAFIYLLTGFHEAIAIPQVFLSRNDS
ncbi:hypothetical protein L6452_20811 [Arctium lappa]|uniref:Uncharacterized protein n=1 Tax=Arctium lappa TaxID=4217 RepID=A0ACB9BGU4_ARCLA|nr:hypothetical protein L6452_20811 [Arctium lappa]